MAFKRHVDRLPVIPADANQHNVTCHYCIVGCGYKAYTWPLSKQGGPAPDENVFGLDLHEQQAIETEAWYAPSMHNVVRQDGKNVHLVIKPDKDCAVNSGLGSVRGARMAENRRSDITGTQQQRLTDPLIWRHGTWQPTSWDDALDLAARVTARVIDAENEDDLVVSMFDHGGSAGGYENTWGTGKLYFDAMKVRNCRIHNRPAYNSEVHATRDMGVGELNNCYEDYQLTDTIFMAGANALETQTNLFLNHMVPALRGDTLDLKRRELPGEAHAPARFVLVDPRRTVTLNACEQIAGAENVLHLQIQSGTDLALFNTLFTYIADQGWVDSAFIEQATYSGAIAQAEDARYPAALVSYEAARQACRISLSEGANICGIAEDALVLAARWIAEPKPDGSRRRTVFPYEKGIIWGNDNYRTIGALVNIGLATGNIGRPGGGVVRLGGHQEGYVRPSAAHAGRPSAYVDNLLIEGGGKVHHVWANDHFKTTLNAAKFKQIYNRRTALVRDAIDRAAGASRSELVDAIVDAIGQGGLFTVCVDIIPSQIGQQGHVLLPAAESGEMNLTSMNGERRLRLTEKYMDPPGSALPDCLIAARLANRLEAVLREDGRHSYAALFQGFDWTREEDDFMDGYHTHVSADVTYDRLRAMGNNGVQEPVTGYADGRLTGTKRLYADGIFSTGDGKARFCAAGWRGLQAPGKQQQKERYAFLINNGRSNLHWQNWFLDQENDFVKDRFPFPFVEMNPDDMAGLGVEAGDLVEIHNDVGAVLAMTVPTPTARTSEVFMVFGAPGGSQGNLVGPGVNELVLPNYKQVWADIRKASDAPQAVGHLSFKSKEAKLG